MSTQFLFFVFLYFTLKVSLEKKMIIFQSLTDLFGATFYKPGKYFSLL